MSTIFVMHLYVHTHIHTHTHTLRCIGTDILCIYFYRESPAVVKQKTREATRCLHLWKQSYLDVRKKIETSGRDARWEFDRKRLFDRSDYMAQICEDIYSIVQVCA